MNVLLLASQEDDVEAISKNMDSLSKTDIFKLLHRALKNQSVSVVEYLLCNKFLSTCADEHLWELAFFELGKTNGNEKKYACCKMLIEHGGYITSCINSYILGSVTLNDTKGAMLALQSRVIIYFLEVSFLVAAKNNNYSVFWNIFPRLSDKKLKKIFFLLAYEQLFEFAFYIFEFYNKDESLLESLRNKSKFIKYIKIFQRTRERAASKIYFWWIPICYQKFGLKMAEKNYEQFCALYDHDKK